MNRHFHPTLSFAPRRSSTAPVHAPHANLPITVLAMPTMIALTTPFRVRPHPLLAALHFEGSKRATAPRSSTTKSP